MSMASAPWPAPLTAAQWRLLRMAGLRLSESGTWQQGSVLLFCMVSHQLAMLSVWALPWEPAACTSVHQLLLLALSPAGHTTSHQVHPHQCSSVVAGLLEQHWQPSAPLCRTHQHLKMPPNSMLAWHGAGHASGIVCLDIAPDGQWVVAVGLDGHSKQLMVLWRLGDLAQEGQVRLVRLTM